MADRDKLIEDAARIARNNPQDWQRLMLSLAALVEQSRTNCITSPIETLQVNQGKAQALTDLAITLGDSVKLQDRIIQRQGKSS